MGLYKILDVNVQSDISLSEIKIRENIAPHYKIIELKKSPLTKEFEIYNRIYIKRKRWLSFSKYGENYGLRFHNFVDFCIEHKNCEIYYYKKTRTNINTLRYLICDQVIPLALSLSNKFIFHASAAQIGSCAICFQAPSGSGKSTIAAYFVKKKHKVLTDDSLLLKYLDNNLYAYPNYPAIRLWPETIKKVFDIKIKTKPVSQFNTKEQFSETIKLSNKPLILKSIYFIHNSNYTNIELLSPTEAFPLLMNNIFRLETNNKRLNTMYFSFINKILNNAKLYKLNYEKKYETLEKVYNLVIDRTLN